MVKVINFIAKAISYLLMALAIVFIAFVWIKGDETIAGDLGLQAQILDPFMTTAYVALGLAVVAAVLFSILSVAMNPKNAVKIIIIIAGLVLLGVVTYSMADNQFGAAQLQKLDTTAEVSRQVGAALYYTYIVGALTILVTIYASIAGLFKR
jgi:hypothetical protein